MNKKKLYWVLQVSGWSLFVCVEILGIVLVNKYEFKKMLFLIGEGVLFFLATHYIRLYLQKIDWLSFKLGKAIPKFLGLAVVISLGIYMLRLPIAYALGLLDFEELYLTDFLGLSTIYTTFVSIWMIFYISYHYFMAYNTSLKNEAEFKEIELNNLKSQLNPHFIFNSLNSIRALVDENPGNSKKAINQLSNILRNSLVSDKKKLTAFEEELKIVKDYLGLESIRYEERLQVNYQIEANTKSFLFPPLMLQTLVENGIKHGIGKLKNGGEISIKAYLTPENLVIEIRNSGHFKEEDKKTKGGLGVANTQRRLEMLYGGKAIFRINNEAENSVLTYLEIPKTEEL